MRISGVLWIIPGYVRESLGRFTGSQGVSMDLRGDLGGIRDVSRAPKRFHTGTWKSHGHFSESQEFQRSTWRFQGIQRVPGGVTVFQGHLGGSRRFRSSIGTLIEGSETL